MTRSARSTWNYLTVIAFSAISMAVALIVTPILLHSLGEARLGATRAVMDWVGYLSLLELGLGGALLPLLARALATPDQSGVRDAMAAGFRAYLRVAAAMLVGGLVLAAVIARLMRVDPIYHRDLRAAALIAITPLLLMPLSPLRALADANQRGYAINIYLIVQSVTIAASAVLFAKIGWGITGQLQAVAIGAIVFGALLVGDALKHYRGLIPSDWAGPTEQASRELWRLNTPTLILNICGRVGLLTDNIIVGSILSASAIVPFFMTQRLAQLAQGQLQAVGSATWAGLAQLHARGEHELFRARFLELNRLVVMLGLIVLLPIIAYNHVFVRLWVGEQQYVGMALTLLAATNAMILALSSLWGWLFSGTGQMARLVPLAIASAVLNLAVSIGLTWWYSKHDPHRAFLGPVLGTTCAFVLVNMPGMPLLLKGHFEISVRQLLVSIAVPLIWGIPYGAAVIWIALHYPPTGWVSLAAHMLLVAIVFAAICWMLLLAPADRARWKLRLRLAAGAGAVA